MSIRASAKPWIALGTAAAAFSFLFHKPAANFWVQLTLSVTGLCLLALLLDSALFEHAWVCGWRRRVQETFEGILAAGVLYGILLMANALAAWLLPFGPTEVADVYRLRNGTSPWFVGLLLAGVIGPGEELFWRGYLQEQLVRRYGITGLGLCILAYGAVHMASGNLLLILASLVCGAFWSGLFWYRRSLWLNMVSHAAWGLAAIVFWPFA